MTRQEAIHLIEWLQRTPTAKQFYGIAPEELLRYYEEQNPALRIHDVLGRSEQFNCLGANYAKGIKPCEEWCGEDMCQKPGNCEDLKKLNTSTDSNNALAVAAFIEAEIPKIEAERNKYIEPYNHAMYMNTDRRLNGAKLFLEWVVSNYH